MGLIDRLPRCFLSTPFSSEFAQLRYELTTTLEDAGVEVPRVEHLSPSRGLAELSREQLRKSDFVVADVTNADPNVIYEVGLAHGIGLPVLLLTQSLESAPATILQDNLFLVYDPKELGQLQLRIRQWISRQFSKGTSR